MRVPFKARCVKFGESYGLVNGEVYTITESRDNYDDCSVRLEIEEINDYWWCLLEGDESKMSEALWNSGSWPIFKKINGKWWKDD